MYILYTVSRINSVLKRVRDKGELTVISTPEERDLLLAVMNSPMCWKMALGERAPSYVCENAYTLSNLYSKFYHENRIADEPDESRRKSRIAISELARALIIKHLSALGIETVDKM